MSSTASKSENLILLVNRRGGRIGKIVSEPDISFAVLTTVHSNLKLGRKKKKKEHVLVCKVPNWDTFVNFQNVLELYF